MEEIHKLQYLLNNVSIISKKYEDIAKITGENFNIFSIMSMESNERYTHSAIIGELLNSKGSHGQGSIFLKLFFEEISCLKEIEDFDFENAKVILEEYIGLINADYTEGGFIDIVIKDNKNVIVIENKIYAPDQKNQLFRYKSYYKDCILLYLNLFGDEPSIESKGSFEKDKDFYIITYQIEIINWLEKCHKETVNQPIVRETINQYINIVKKLTNQTINNKMSEEIIELLKKNINEAFNVRNSIEQLKKNLYDNFLQNIQKYYKEKDFAFNVIDKKTNFGISIKPKEWKEAKYEIQVLFESQNYDGLFYGLYIYETDKETIDKLKDGFLNANYSDKWGYYFWKWTNKNCWSDNADIWEDVARGEDSIILKEIINGINEIIEIEKCNKCPKNNS